MSLIHSIQSMLPRPENRSRDEIARDLEDEFDFHLEMKARHLMAEAPGLQRDEAKDAARRMFGDVEAVKLQCQRIALRERIMLQRVNLVLMILVMLVVVAVGAQVYITQRYNTLALQAITADLARMKFEAMAATRPDGANAASTDASSAETQARVLVEGDVAEVGWQSIDMDRGTRMSDLLRSLNVRDDQWVTYRRNGATGSATPHLARDYITDSGEMVLRPNDELTIRNTVPIQARRTYYTSRWSRSDEQVTMWKAATAQSGHWHLRIDSRRGGGLGTLVREGDEQTWTLSFRPEGLSIIARSGGASANAKFADWDLIGDRLILDFSNLRDDPRVPRQSPSSAENAPKPEMPEISGALAFERSSDESAFQQHVRLATRAQAVGYFVLELMTIARPDDPQMREHIIDFLDRYERSLDQEHADDLVAAAMIRELIMARRKLFEADDRAAEAATTEAKLKALNDFLANMLVAADPTPAPGATVTEVLEKAAQRAEIELSRSDPATQTRVKEVIETARRQAADEKNVAQPPAATQPAGDAAGVSGADDSQAISPFTAVRWKDQWTPIVNYAGTWYELRSIHGADAQALVQHCRARHGEERARQRVSEDLLAMLMEMGHARPENDQVKMQIVDLNTGSLIAVNEAAMTAENRAKILVDNAAAKAKGEAHPAWTGDNQ